MTVGTALERLERRKFAERAIGYAVTQMALSSTEKEFAAFARALQAELIRRGIRPLP